jgi:type IV pilus assembly protein PilX
MSRGMEGDPEKGSAMVMGIVFLLVLTLLAVVGMQTTILEEKMAGNLRDRELAFRAAEAALRAAEGILQSPTLPDFDAPDQGLYQADPDLLSGLDWTELDSGKGGDDLQGINSSPRYVIEEHPPLYGSADVLFPDESVPPDRFYRVTSKGTGGTDSAVSILQTTYKR